MRNYYLNWLLLTILIPAFVGCVQLNDRRTSGTFVEDGSIESKAAKRIEEQLGNSVHINVTSFNRNVLLTGEVPNDAMKQQAEKLTMSVQNVRNIFNEIVISGKTSLHSRSTDAVTTSRVKGRFLQNGKFRFNHIKVVTENGVVFLLGLVKHEEGDSAAEIASSTSGVLRVVKAFEYLD